MSEIVIGACIEVHRHLGPGLLESVYEECVCHELGVAGIAFERQKTLPVLYKGLKLQPSYRLDLIVEDQLLIELKAVERLLPVHEAQVITYLKLSGLPVGLLVNFHTAAIKHGLRRLINNKNLTGSPAPCDPSSR
ncbi:MAG TPA: GxxExxY protein [Polyangiales bacterium]|nr:GxxExxY protein [Polyangiales bacterium]